VVLPLLLDFLTKYRPRVGQILLGFEKGSWTDKDLRRLENLVVQNTDDPGTARDFLRVLRKACGLYVVRERKGLNLPWIPVVLAEPKNPFRFNLSKMLERYAAWKRLLEAQLTELSANEQLLGDDRGPSVEMVLVSAILYGGLHNIPSLVALIRAVPDMANRTIVVDGRMHIELSLSWRGIRDMELRRWQPDPLTATLWSHIRVERAVDLLQPQTGTVPPDISDRDLARRISRLLRDGIGQTPAKGGEVPRGGLAGLLRATQTVAHIELPSVLAAYSSRNLVSHSLRRGALQRLSKGALPIIETSLLQSVPEKAHEVSSHEVEPRVSEEHEQPWLRDLCGLMRGKDRNVMCNELAVRMVSGDTNLFARRMADFCDSLLVVRKVGGKLRSPASAGTVVKLIARHMEGPLNGRDPADLTTEALETLYTQMIESIPVPLEGMTSTGKPPHALRERSDLARALLEFHRYMIGRHEKGAIEDGGFFRAEAGLVAVDANILTMEDYTAVLDEIEDTWPSTDYPERKQIARQLVILGFRCGLRRMEALRLPIRDLVSGSPMELLIRPMKTRKLKSRNAVRRLPIGFLTIEAELKELLEWCDARTSDQSVPAPRFLFGNARKQLDVVPQTIFEQINQILRKVTEDPTIHFHHLRHSFATWTWLSLMLADMTKPPDLFPHLEMTTAWLRESAAFRSKLYGHGMVTRKHTYMLAQLLGHGSPATSMEHYVHCADWLLYLHLERSSLMRPEQSHVLLASGRPRQTTSRWTLNQPAHAIPLRLWSQRVLKRSSQSKSKSQGPREGNASERIPVQPQPDTEWIRRAYDFLYTCVTFERPREEAARKYGFDDVASRRILMRAHYVCDIRSGSARRRHRLESFTPDRRRSDEERILACPRRPTNPLDKEVVERFSSTLEVLANNEPEMVHRALHCYVRHVWNSRDLMVLHDLSEANDGKAYVELLMRLGVPRKDIRWASFSRHERSSSLASWKRAFSLNRHNRIERIRPPNNRGDAAEAWFGIAPRFHLEADGNRAANPGTFGFRFLMLMGFITFGRI
jgi:integrase